ncbi:hypothetical protein [Planobispora takensis]|uniref:hypothetical protein n=1 Tax=Planobispora takensis TaxID=1367882 RepID=UPI0035EDE8DC
MIAFDRGGLRRTGQDGPVAGMSRGPSHPARVPNVIKPRHDHHHEKGDRGFGGLRRLHLWYTELLGHDEQLLNPAEPATLAALLSGCF